MSIQPDDLFLSFQLALAGRYSIDRELGRGGMGVVYLANEVQLDRLVAIKLLPPDRAANPVLRERFLREARLAAKLSHPNIIPIHAVAETDGFVYYVMAFVDGETLGQRVRRRGPLSASEGVRVVREVAWALASAHAQGIVHRDVKPENILLEAASHRVLVADFGIAAALGDAPGEGITGTPEFMSPEQALGHDVDARSDLYSLGVTAFYALSGRLPFEGRTATEVLARQVTEEAPTLATLGLAVSRKISSLVERCLAKDPAQRPAGAEALAEQLGVALEQRRELPVALRAFARRTGRLDGGGTMAVPIVLLVASTAVGQVFGVATASATFGTGLSLTALSALVLSARRLAKQGFAYGDLAPAFRAELEAAREERALEQAGGPSTLERFLKITAKVSALGVAIPCAMVLYFVFTRMPAVGSFPWVGTLATISIPVVFASTTWYLTLLQRRTDLDTLFWAGLWGGRVGRAAWSIAKQLLRGKTCESANTHRVTELSLGMAVESLYERLPKSIREELATLPALLRRLQDAALALRLRADDLQAVLSDAGEAATGDVHESLTRDRDAVQAKLAETVGALELIRLSLLRLHTGSLTVVGLTSQIGLAAEMSAEVERMLSARSEVEHIVRFPNEVALTPS